MNLGALIEFIKDNLAFVLLIIGGIFSLMKRALSQEKDFQRKKSRSNQPKKQETVLVQQKSIMKQNKVEHVSSVGTLDRKEIDHEYVPQVEETEFTQEFETNGQTSTQLHPKSTRDSFKSVNKKKVVQGMIWSEIIGPPRSKRPHNKTTSYHRVR